MVSWISEVPSVEKDALEAGYESLDAFIQSLCDTGLVARKGTGKICLLSRGCQVMMIGDKNIMGENISGRLDNWLMKHAEVFMPWKKKGTSS